MFASSQIIKNNIMKSKKRTNIYIKINPILFDISLRDGIQNAKIENFPLHIKKTIFDTIFESKLTTKIEIGSIVSSKILPIMNDSIDLFKYINTKFKDIKYNNYCYQTDTIKTPKIYILIPSITKLIHAFDNDIQNFSFITSISNEFQIRNNKKSIKDTKEEFVRIFNMIIREPGSRSFQTKLYISCINECPFIGKIDNDTVVNEILFYYRNYTFDELCLSDTMGSLNSDDFIYIIEKCRELGINISKISLHLHIKKHNIENTERILFYSFTNNINKFDISCLETGGCSVTMKNGLISNLTYDIFFSILWKYIENIVKSK
jgi:isopropylmalate/homocitrate/citramalate synthase